MKEFIELRKLYKSDEWPTNSNPSKILEISDVIEKKFETNSEIIVRCYPWCGRNGGHTEKAYAHLVFTEEEFQKMGFLGRF